MKHGLHFLIKEASVSCQFSCGVIVLTERALEDGPCGGRRKWEMTVEAHMALQWTDCCISAITFFDYKVSELLECQGPCFAM